MKKNNSNSNSIRKQSEDHSHCIVCGQKENFHVVGECNHSQVCLFCAYKFRTFYKELKCPFCMQKNENIIAFESQDDNSNVEYSKFDFEDCYKDDRFHKNGIYYADITSKEEILKNTSYKCPFQDCNSAVFEDLRSLMTHTSRQHQRYFCDICVREGKKYISEALLYNYNALQIHKEYGDLDENNLPVTHVHPECKVSKYINILFSSS